jgi:3-phenylpropionate/trans-cinnamate dioxygenase ferredoxin reductase subunit
MADRIVVVGAGQAGAELVSALRAGGHQGALTLIGAEPAPPYQRPPLSKKYLLGEMSAERLWLRPETFYRDHGVDLVLGAEVAEIDRAGRRALLADGRAFAYDQLALTTGARPRRLPAAIGGDLAGAHVVRTLADVDAMAADLAPGRRVVIVGGGYIGLEAAAVAVARGLRVCLIEAAPRILQRVASAETATYFADLHRTRGVDLREGVGLARLEGDHGRLARAILADGEAIEADFAVVGIGVVPDDALAAAAGLTLDNGIAVDAFGATSDPAIFASGDCASFPWRGRRIRLESVQNAIDQARATAASMLGARAAYDPVPWFWSDQYDVKLQIAGLNAGYDRTITRPGAREAALSVWYFDADRLLAVDAMNDPRAYMSAKRWLEAGVSPDPARIADPAWDLKNPR